MQDDNRDAATLSAGGALFGHLKALGIDYVFANSGTDFPPIIEGLVTARQQDLDIPVPVTVPHEHAALGMAHGYYQISGRGQAVMLHTNVGLANGAIGAINAWCDQVPMLLMSGRTPVTESDRFGARTVPIGWGQEMYDQTALVRETTKWDFELRFPEQMGALLNRGWAIANSTPRGPVYMSLPREVLSEPAAASTPPVMAPVNAGPTDADLAAAVEHLSKARTPVVIAQRGAGSAEAFDALGAFLLDWGIPLSHYWANQVAIPLSHPMQIGQDPNALLEQADVILVIDALAPWWPDKVCVRDDATVIQLGPDPLFSRTPVRTFSAHLSLPGDTATTLLALINRMQGQPRDEDLIAARRAKHTEAARANRAAVIKRAEDGCADPMTKDWVSLCVGRAIKGRRASIFHELGCPLGPLDVDQHLGYFQEPHSGGLGWGLPAALGGQLADPDRLVFATIGDGSYMFANPTACHLVAEAMGLPVITLVLNNAEWGAVRHSVEGMYPDGSAARANQVPLTALTPSPDFAMVAAASRAYTETVTHGADLPDALDRAIRVATEERRQVLMNIAIQQSAPG